MLERDGFLVLGAAETVVGLTDAFKPVPDKRGLYAPNKDAVRPANLAAFAADAPAGGRGSALSFTSCFSDWVARGRAPRADRARAHPTAAPSVRRG